MAASKIKTKLPSGEKIATVYSNTKGVEMFVLTKHEIKGNFILYKIVSEGYELLGTSENPFVLEEKYNVIKKLSS